MKRKYLCLYNECLKAAAVSFVVVNAAYAFEFRRLQRILNQFESAQLCCEGLVKGQR